MATQILTSVVGGSAIASLTSAAGSAASSLLATTTSGPAFSPLTTRFVPPSYCSKEFNNCGFGSGLCNYLLRDVTCGSDGRPTLATDCFPPALRFPDITAWGGDVAYSPAVACPVGWRTMSDSSTPGVSLGTRVVACCPGSFPSTYAGYCSSSITFGTGRSSAYSCSGSTAIEVAITPISTASIYTVNAMRILLVVDNSVPFTTFASPSPTPPSTLRMSSSVPATSRATTGGSGDADTFYDPSSKKKLSGGAIAGIVIGILALLSLLFLFFFIRRKKRTSDPNTDHPELVSTSFGNEKPGAKAPYQTSQDTTPRSGQPEYMPISTNSPPTQHYHNTSGMPVYTPAPYNTSSSQAYSTNESIISALPEQQISPAMSQRPYSSVTSNTQFSSIPSQFPSPYVSEVGENRDSMSEVARLEADKALLEERIARMRSVAQMEEEQERVRRRIEELKGSGGRG